MEIEIKIPGEPVPKGRPRFRVSKTGYVMTYTPQKTQKEEARIKSIFRQIQNINIHNFPLKTVESMDIVWFFKRPQRLNRKKDPSERIPHTKKPDMDNLLKLTWDAMKDIILVDDSNVYKLTMEKYYVAKNGTPRTEIKITWGEDVPKN